MSITIVFNNSKPFDPSDNRPYADVAITDSRGNSISPTYVCLVDTGSDYIVLPYGAASRIALSGNKKTLRGVTGSMVLDFETNLYVVIEGLLIKTDVLFESSPASGFVPILGRAAILTAFDLGMDVGNWLY
jgi:predicted aspartyl protease